MCYVLIEHDNWIADTGYDCSDGKGEKLKVELEETIGKKIDEIVADIRQHPNLIKAVNQSLMKALQIFIDLTPPKQVEESTSLDW